MLFFAIFGFILCAIVELVKGDTNLFLGYMILVALFSIAATIEYSYERWEEKKKMEYKAFSEAINNMCDEIKKQNKNQ